MKIPVTPPDLDQIIKANLDVLPKIFQMNIGPTDNKGRYLHWDKLRHLSPPETIGIEELWAGIKIQRSLLSKNLPFLNKSGDGFKFCIIDSMQKDLHWLDLNAAGTISADKPMINTNMQGTYLISSLFEEAINSSQLEGAVTTRNVAKEMLRQRRGPKDKSEQMILNNYHAMQFIRDFKTEAITPSFILELHRILTEKTLKNPDKAGVLRLEEDDIEVVDTMTNTVLHVPPKASDLEKRLDILCDFANKILDVKGVFIHPVVRAIALHFMLAYDHPFVDGNGRTARALFYWSMVNQGYWLAEFISISRILKQAPVQYGKAFLYTETDGNDVTYFIIHQLEVIKKAISDLHLYLEKKTKGITQAQDMLQDAKNLGKKLNFRQLALLRHALKHPGFTYKINEHKNSHGISYETARKDLLFMSDNTKLLVKFKAGKSFVFMSPPNLEERIKKQ
ncbi:Fic family protein [Desulfobacula phenolica]|uniref:Fic family protein n=1 Tax=Desulfobacula phenolica TaxID=90732 RepID=A0A1H2FEH0_9BACT|nr:Fic family protein [Desulfobacula phenolica]SDU05786.1 Fic family protein [Desulfobacula phenolica]